MRLILAILFGALASGALVFSAQAQSLSGQKGDVRYRVQFPNPKDACKKAYDAYVAASGHSAYAQTPSGRFANAEAFFCAVVRNAPSQKAAEERVLVDCKRTGEKYKVKTAGRCEVYASK
jgi:hypothetical protein